MTDTTWAEKVLERVPTTSIRRPGSDEDSITVIALNDAIAALKAQVAEAGKMLAEQDSEYNRKTNDLIERHAKQTAALRAKVARLEGALRKLHHAVCGETGFAACVRLDSGKAYPWPALDDADKATRAALTDGGKDG